MTIPYDRCPNNSIRNAEDKFQVVTFTSENHTTGPFQSQIPQTKHWYEVRDYTINRG